jgi:hypothetical protein
MTDEQFFTVFSGRQYRIRKPERILIKDKQRATYYGDECLAEFLSLGPHDKERRRILVWRVTEGNPHYDPMRRKLLTVPMLLFSDETIEDDDATLATVFHGIMQQARASY